MTCSQTLDFSHLDRFPENLGDLNEEQVEHFHQDIRTMEERYQVYWNANMMADYWWRIQSSTAIKSYKRKVYSNQFCVIKDFSLKTSSLHISITRAVIEKATSNLKVARQVHLESRTKLHARKPLLSIKMDFIVLPTFHLILTVIAFLRNQTKFRA
jgi:hypothetical protein